MALRNLLAGLFTQDDGNKVSQLLRSILERLPFIDPTSAGARVTVQNTVPVSGTLAGVTTVTTVTTVSTVSAVAGVTAIGGLLANADQYAQMQQGAAALRNRITIT